MLLIVWRRWPARPVVALALVAMLVAVWLRHPLPALLLAVGTGGGGYLLITRGPSWRAGKEELAADEGRHGRQAPHTRYSLGQPAAATADGDNYTWGGSDAADEEHRRELEQQNLFRSLAQPYVDACFANEDPDGAQPAAEKTGREETRGLREALTSDIRRHYAGPDIYVGRLGWLITWRAKQARERWENGSLRDRHAELRAAAPRGSLVGLGVVGVVAGVLCGVVGLFSGGNAIFGIALCCSYAQASGRLYASKIDAYMVRHRLYEAESALAAQAYAEEKAAFDSWTEALADRPSDAEMARWLDYDKLYAKNLAMNTFGLANRDIVAHAILTEARYPCQRARALFGPPRYSHYKLIIFLLTEAGVRQVGLDFDFLDGIMSNQKRTNFRYDAISSARVAEVGVRFDSGRRSVVAMDDRPEDTKPPKDVDSLIFSRAFQLSLVDGQRIDVVVENFDHGFFDPIRENVESLFDLVLDSSGVNEALRIFESVAAEGRDWLVEERMRRSRGLLDFSRASADRGELSRQVSQAPLAESESADREPDVDLWQLPGSGSRWGQPADGGSAGQIISRTRSDSAVETSGFEGGGDRSLGDSNEQKTGGPPNPPGEKPDYGGGGPGPMPRYLKGQCPQTVPVGKPFSLLASIVLAPDQSTTEMKFFDVPPRGLNVLLPPTHPDCGCLVTSGSVCTCPPRRILSP